MSSTISITQVGTFKRFKAQYIAAAAGIALAVTAVAGGLALRNDTASTTSAPISSGVSAEPFYPQVQEQSHPQISAASLSQPAGGFPLVQEMSHPVVPAASSLEVTTSGLPFYPLVQEQSHPVILPASTIEAATATGPFYPLVQEQSHPVVPVTSSLEATTSELPFYPQVQEQSHPIAPVAQEAPGTYPLVQEQSHPR